MEKRLTRAKAVKIFCQTCMGCDEWYGEKAGTKKNEASIMVKNCESVNCPLYNFRTGKDTTPASPKKTFKDDVRGAISTPKNGQNSKMVSTIGGKVK